MPIPGANIAPLEVAIGRLASESVLAQPGSIEGLLPSYSLLGDIAQLCEGEPQLQSEIAAPLRALEQLIDSSQGFTGEILQQLRSATEWLSSAVDCHRMGRPLPARRGGLAAIPVAEASPKSPDRARAEDKILELNLDENRELLSEFRAETVDHLQQIEAALLELDHDQRNAEALSAIFRSFHTIKGNAGFLGLAPLHTLAHEVESVLDLARNGKLQLTAGIITEILRSRDALQVLTNQISEALDRGVMPAEAIVVDELVAALKKSAAAGEQTGAPPAADSRPEPAEPRNHPAPVQLPAVAKAGGTVPDHKSASSSVRVSTQKLDSLMDVVGELVIVQSQLVESARISDGINPGLQRSVGQLNRIAKELQSTSMALRMIPIKQTFQKMERVARDLARELDRKVVFVTSGEDTELDRTVVEEISDPLVHMIRNSVDHGLEDVPARIAAGKPEAGRVQLKAYHQGSNIVIELSDDGRGIDPDKIYRKAVETGLIAAGTELTKDEILALIFAPGFSTAKKVTAVSGRGVGMDVVRRNIEKLRGKIEITSDVGRGSTFTIRLPLTMAIIDGLIVRVGEDRFILPSTSVSRALRPAREHVSTVGGRGEVLDMRGKFVPIHRLHELFRVPAEAKQPWDGIVIIVETANKVHALLVDEMVSKQEVVIKNLGAFLQNIRGVAGGAILGDGNIALILDPASLLAAA